MIFLLLIFFTSLGSAVATSDNDLSDLSSDVSSNLAFESPLEISSDISSDIHSDSSSNISSDMMNDGSKDLENSYFYQDSASFNLEGSLLSEDADVNKKDEKANEKNIFFRDVLSSSLATEDSSAINNGIILTKSQSSSLLSSPRTIIIGDPSHYDGSINEYVQELIDNAADGSTIQFTGSSYEDIYLKISKPLNIISKSGTRINNIFNIPVFTILDGGSGTNISGFTVNSSGSFVDASYVSGITISGNKISTKRNGIVFNEVYDSKIKNNVFSSFKIAIDISKSGGIDIYKNNITPSDWNNIGINLKEISSKKGIRVVKNNLIAKDRRKEAIGIYFGKNASNVLVKENVIRRWYTAIEFPYSVNNVTITNNTLMHNGDGVIVNGWIDNFTFNKNLVQSNSRVGVLFDYDFMGTKGNFTLENNYFSYNGVLDLQNKGDKAVSIGKNFAKNRCYRVGMKYGFHIKSRQNGGKYYFSVVDRYGRAVSGLPNFSATLTVNGKSYIVNFIDSVAYLDTGDGAGGQGSSSNSYLDIGEDSRKFSDWGQYEEVDLEDMEFYEEFYKELLNSIMESANSNPNSNSSNSNLENGSGSSSNSGSGSGDSGLSSGSNSINSNGVLSGSSGSASASVSPASTGPSSSQNSNVPESASAKTLSVDEETFRVIGVGGLVLLIILVIGLYYREDIKYMMKK